MSTQTSSTESTGRSAITEHEIEQIERANAASGTPVVFIHGLWLLPSSWERWATVFEEAGYVALTPGWPDDPDTVEQANEHPEVFARKTVGQVADHFSEIIGRLDAKPAVIGHSFGGLLTQISRRARQRVAGGRRHGARVRPSVRLTASGRRRSPRPAAGSPAKIGP